MSSFIVDLWESIFVPGPTPTILRATNASFAALQVTLLALLFATYSVHFVVLSILSAGLWWSINWFATELAAAKARGEIPSGDEAEADEKKADDAQVPPPPKKDGSDEDTEVESRGKERQKRGKKAGKGSAARVAKAPADVEAVDAKGTMKHRVASVSDSTGFTSQSSVSTEDEWEKVSENENDKTK